jgi:hypothetical protein
VTTVAELMEELARYPRQALVTVRLTPETAAAICAKAGNFEVDDVEPNGCNVFDIQIHLGGER